MSHDYVESSDVDEREELLASFVPLRYHVTSPHKRVKVDHCSSVAPMPITSSTTIRTAFIPSSDPQLLLAPSGESSIGETERAVDETSNHDAQAPASRPSFSGLVTPSTTFHFGASLSPIRPIPCSSPPSSSLDALSLFGSSPPDHVPSTPVRSHPVARWPMIGTVDDGSTHAISVSRQRTSPHAPSPLSNRHLAADISTVSHSRVGDVSDSEAVMSVADNPPDEPRYRFRRRAINQLKPYTVEKIQYQHALRSNPDAVVKFCSPKAKRHDEHRRSDSKYGEDDDDRWSSGGETDKQGQQRTSIDTSPTISAAITFPEILQDLPLTEDETDGSGSISVGSKRFRKTERHKIAKRKGPNMRLEKFPLPAELEGGDDVEVILKTTEDLQGSSLPSPTDESLECDLPKLSNSSSPSVASRSDDYSVRYYSPASPLKSPRSVQPHRSSPGLEVSWVDKNDGDDLHNVLDRKRLRALNRMIPAFMVRKLISVDKRREPRRSSSLSSQDEDEDDLLLPGQTRTRRADHPKDIREIKGDTESSDDADDTDGNIPDLPPQAYDSSNGARHGSPRPQIELTDSDKNDLDSDSTADDDTTRSYLVEKPNSKISALNKRPREESLIDWMLSGRRTIGSKKAASGKKRKKIDVAVGGGRRMGNAQQSILPFRSSTAPGKAHHESSGIVSSNLVADTPLDYANVTYMDTSDVLPGVTRKRKRSNGRNRPHDVYTFASKHTYIATGRKDRATVTVDIEDETFYTALAPSWDDCRSNTRKDGPANDLKSFTHHGARDRMRRTGGQKTRLDIRGDFNIPVLHSGLCFGPSTYLAKGGLHDFIEAFSGRGEPITPITTVVCGAEFGPSMHAADFSHSLSRVFDGLFDLIADMPDPGLLDEWRTNIARISQLASWLLSSASPDGRVLLQDSVCKCSLQAISRLRRLVPTPFPIDIPALLFSWFVVEVLARLGLSLASNPLLESLSLLVEFLLLIGFKKVMMPILEGHHLDSSTKEQYGAELWICIFHLLDQLHINDANSTTAHPFWSMVRTGLEKTCLAKSHLETSEIMWHAIFALCALTQFSVHGMTTSASRLPASWDVAAFALKQVRLTADPNSDCELPSSALDKRDEYIGLITLRCFHLWHRWHWQLTNASVLFNTLAEIFRSRKFANLRHERAEYPAFMLNADWNLLSQPNHRDSAFTLFLKLMVQAVGDTSGDSSSRAKKLLSLALPIGSLPFSKSKPVTMQELSMLYNRLSAVAISIHLDPAHHTSRVTHARSYVKFSDADDMTRIAVIRGMMNLAILMLRSKLSLGPIADWIREMTGILAEEFKELQVLIHNSVNGTKEKARLVIQTMLGSVRKIFDAHLTKHEYPEPALLASLYKPLLNQSLVEERQTSEEIRRLCESLLHARLAVLPPPERPRILVASNQESQESQDEFGVMEFNFDDPALIAALDTAGNPALPAIDYQSKEQAFLKALSASQLLWISWRTFRKAVENLNDDVQIGAMHHIDGWLSCWLGCAAALVRNGAKSWDVILNPLETIWAEIETRPWSRRIDLAVMIRILRLDPMTFTTHYERYMQVLADCLVCPEGATEYEFVQLFLSFGGYRWTLLDGFSEGCDADYARFQDLRQSLLKTLLGNLGASFRPGAAPTVEEKAKHTKLCVRMLSTLQKELTQCRADDLRHAAYLEWCKTVLRLLRSVPELTSRPEVAAVLPQDDAL